MALGSRKGGGRSHWRVLVWVTMLVVGVTAMQMTQASAASGDTSVVVDDHSDSYIGTGGLLLPAASGSPARHDAYECKDCRWAVEWACHLAHTAGCLGNHFGCRVGYELLRVSMQRPGEPWKVIVTYCSRTSRPALVGEVEASLRQRFVRHVPALQATSQPKTIVFAGLPVFFSSGQPGQLPVRSFSLLGAPVRLWAQPTWTWDFAETSSPHGGVLVTSNPGGAWPAGKVTHTYGTVGKKMVRVGAEWKGTYTIDGLGPYAVEGAIHQSQSVAVLVKPAQAVVIR